MKIGELRPEQSATVEALVRELQNLDSSAFPALYSLAENGMICFQRLIFFRTLPSAWRHCGLI